MSRDKLIWIYAVILAITASVSAYYFIGWPMVAGFWVGLIAGWAVAIYRVSRDPSMIKIEEDQAICIKPPDGHVLMAVTPEIARKLVNVKNLTQSDMRSLLWNQQ